mmetsp:Transcript_17353/g.29176  ORF Transcript_17353/g.29176 Transcript_17353/m.29176 type:complete len:148 (-) Transcript_17353:192-635(-)
MIAAHNNDMHKKNNLQNLSYLADQIQKDRQRKDRQRLIDKQYYKPHFGPEETDLLLDLENSKVLNTKTFVKKSLLDQINQKTTLRHSMFNQEREGDLQNLHTAHNMFVVEERAKQAKNMKEKMDNKQAWTSQMNDKNLMETMDNLFR